MFLIGLIAGVVLTVVSGKTTFRIAGAPSAPTAPTAPGANAPTAPGMDTETRMAAYSKDLGIDETAFKNCVAENTYTTTRPYACTDGPKCLVINDQMSGGQAGGVSGTPGNIVYDLTSKKGILLSGAQPVTNFQSVIDGMLKNPANAMAQPGVALAQNVTAIDFENDHIRGDEKATIAVIEYSDYECPFCHSVHPTYQQLMQKYDGKIMWVYRHFPLNFHAEAIPLALGAECASELAGNDAFWEFSDKVMGE